MASRLEIFHPSVPANMAIATPVIIETLFDVGVVERIEILVPPGPSGLMGFGIMHGGASVFPREEDRWIIADDEPLQWDVQDLPTAGDWAFRMYNTDVFPHTIHVRFLVHEVDAVPAAALRPIRIEQPNQPAPSVEDTRAPALLTGPGV